MLRTTIVLIFISNLTSVLSIGDVKHMGCYDSLEVALYKSGVTLEPFSWKRCVTMCLDKLTVFASVSGERRVCVCHNSVPDHWTVTLDGQCQSCNEDPSRYCGGWASVSLYRLTPSETPPLALLLATEKGVEMLLPKSSSQPTTLLSFPGVEFVDFNYRNHELYFVSNSKIYRSTYSFVEMKYNNPELVVEANCTIVDFSVDWRRHCVYFTCTDNVYESCLDVIGYNCVEIDGPTKDYTNLLSFKFSPYERINWFVHHNVTNETETGEVLCMHFYNHGSQVSTKLTFSSILKEDIVLIIKKGMQFTLDIQLEKVYAITSFVRTGNVYLLSIDIQTSFMLDLYKGTELWDAFALDAFNGTVIWGVEDFSNYSLYRGTIIEDKLRDFSVFHTGPEKINHIRIYHSELQNPNTGYLCEKKNCSHSCSLVSVGYVRCSCPDDLVLAQDARTCVQSPVHDSVVTSTPSTDLLYESTLPEEFTATKEATIENTSNDLNPTLMDEALPTTTKPTTLVKSHESIMFLSFTILLCVFVLVIVFFLLIYVVLYLRKIHTLHKQTSPETLVLKETQRQ